MAGEFFVRFDILFVTDKAKARSSASDMTDKVKTQSSASESNTKNSRFCCVCVPVSTYSVF